MFASQAAPYEAASKQAGDAVRMTVMPEAGHFLFIDPQSAVWPQVLAGVQGLLSKPDQKTP
jgi:pimeloyl-ACP methyl ester carboxylesterase